VSKTKIIPKRIRLPDDLKPGDRIVDNHGVQRVVGEKNGDLRDHVCTDAAVFCSDGWRWQHKNGYAVKVIRKGAKDKDAEWLRSIASSQEIPIDSKYAMRRLRRIAKRLEGSGP
jgi:hypothetical protein